VLGTFVVIVWIETAKWQENRQGVRNQSRIGRVYDRCAPPLSDPTLGEKSDMSRIGKVYDRCDPAFRRGSLVRECYASVGSRLSVWCLRLKREVWGGRCAVSCISGLTCSLIVNCNFMYVLSIVVDTFVMFKLVCSVSFLTYQGVLVIKRRTRFWNLCILSICVLDAQPHIAQPYCHTGQSSIV
jgi:hypothetical protein